MVSGIYEPLTQADKFDHARINRPFPSGTPIMPSGEGGFTDYAQTTDDVDLRERDFPSPSGMTEASGLLHARDKNARNDDLNASTKSMPFDSTKVFSNSSGIKHEEKGWFSHIESAEDSMIFFPWVAPMPRLVPIANIISGKDEYQIELNKIVPASSLWPLALQNTYFNRTAPTGEDYDGES